MLHSWYSRDGPRQGMPPYLGSGLLQTRFRFRMPLLQSRLHCDHDVQADQAPLTVWAEYLPARRKSPERPSVEQPLVPSLEQYRISILCLPTSNKFGSGRRALHVYLNRCS